MGQASSTALLQAAATNDIDATRSLLDQGGNVNCKEEASQWTPLHHAAWGGHEEVVRELIVRGAEVNARDIERKTPLTLAVLGGHDLTAAALCDHNADVSAADQHGQTPLHKCAAQDQLALTQELVARGANIEARLQDGSTPAHLAAWKGHTRILSYLLESGADANAVTEDMRTPLHEAAASGQEECCRLLLRHGARRAALDADSCTPADSALMHDYIRAAEVVRPQPGELQRSAPHSQGAGQLHGAQQEAQPSAPVWQDDAGPIRYPELNSSRETASQSSMAQANDSQQSRPQVRQGQGTDWEPQSEEDWEGVSPPASTQCQGARLMEDFETRPPSSHNAGDPFWMIPQPVRWAAASLGGVLSGMNPFRGQEQSPEQPADSEDEEPSIEAQEAKLTAKEARVAHLAGSRTRDQLTAEQVSRLEKQEAEIADLKRRLEATKSASTSQQQAEGRRIPAATAAQEDIGRPRNRHHLLDVPAEPPLCREMDHRVLSEATGKFGAGSKIGRTAYGSAYKARLEGKDLTVLMPEQRNVVHWHELKAAAEKLLRVNSAIVAPIRAISKDGAVVFDRCLYGSVDDALRARAPSPGTAPVRLSWCSRLELAVQAAQGLLDLHRAQPQIIHAALEPAAMLLTEPTGSKLTLAPNLAVAADTSKVDLLSPYSAPEVRRGDSPSPRSDVYSLGIVIMQLLTGSEASGLAEHILSSPLEGRQQHLLDPCADGMSRHSADPIANLAARCCAFYPEERPDLEAEVLPALQRAAAAVKTGSVAPEEEPPAHLVCPITQDVMRNPVILADGYTYEQSAIREWLDKGKLVSPMTNAPLAHANITPNFVIKSAASTWRDQHPEKAGETEQSLDELVRDMNRLCAQQTTAAEGRSGNDGSAQPGEEDLPSVPTEDASRAALQAYQQTREHRHLEQQPRGELEWGLEG